MSEPKHNSEALLAKQGWLMYYSCHCGGSLRQHWSNTRYPGYEIRLRPTRATFTLLLRNTVVHGPNYVYNLEKKLTEYEVFDSSLV